MLQRQFDCASGLIGPEKSSSDKISSRFGLVGSVQNPKNGQNQGLRASTYQAWPNTTFCPLFLRLALCAAPIDLKLFKSFFSPLSTLVHLSVIDSHLYFLLLPRSTCFSDCAANVIFPQNRASAGLADLGRSMQNRRKIENELFVNLYDSKGEIDF